MTADNPLTSEEDIIQGYLAPLAASMPGAHGLKDDCATAAPAPGYEFILKTDPIAEGIHFLSGDAPEDIGWKALAVNVSDLAAKGARPYGYLMSLSFPAPPERAWMAAFARGLGEAQSAFGIGLLGGDTDRRPGPLAIAPTVIGEAPVGRMVPRATARPGDILYVTGTLGDASLGLVLRQSAALAKGWRLMPHHAQAMIARYLRPQPRLALAAVILAHARASMDVSDGLMKDLGRMCKASGCGAVVEHAALPVSAAFAAVRAVAPEAAARALFAGDDYEVLCAIAPQSLSAFVEAANLTGLPVTRIGQITDGSAVVLRDADGTTMVPSSGGWDHF